MENNKRPSLAEQQQYSIGEAEQVLQVGYQQELFVIEDLERENIALDENHYIQKFFENFRSQYEFTSVGDDAKNISEFLTVFQESAHHSFSFQKNTYAKQAVSIVNNISIDSLRIYAIAEHTKAFSALQQTPERYERLALDEKEHWRRMAVASTRAYNREQAKNV